MCHRSRVLVLLLAAVSPLAVSSARAQCSDDTTEWDYWNSVTRTSGNNIEADAATQVTGDGWAYWEVYLNGVTVKLASTTINSGRNNSGSYGGNNTTDLADAATELIWNDALSMYGAGTYTINAPHEWKSTCGDDDTYTDSESLTITQPSITVPGGGSGPYAFWYLGGYPNPDNYNVTASFTGNANLGTCNGCNPVYNWQVIPNPNVNNPQGAVSLSSTSTTSTTLTSQHASNGNVYDLIVTFTVDGFSSQQVLLNIDTPVGILVSRSNQVSDPQGCSNPTVYGGYDNQYYYYEYDLWNYALAPLTTNEQNDSYTPLTTIGSTSWYRDTINWQDDSVWSNYLTGATPWSTSFEFLDHIYASQCSNVWTPPPVEPAGLNKPVQSAPQAFHSADQTTGQGISLGTYTQTWYTDHGTN